MGSVDVLALALEEQARARAIVAGLGLCPVVLSRGKATLGSFCIDRHNGSMEIRISRYIDDEAQVRETARHELAHQAAWERYRDFGHGALWQTFASYLGCAPVSCTQYVVPDRDRYAITCDACGWSTTRARRSKLVTRPWSFACASCGGVLQVAAL